MTIFAQTGRDGSERSGAGRGGRPAGGIPHWLSSKTDKSPVRRWIELRYRARCKYLFINKIPPRDQLHDFKWNNIIFFWSFRHRIFHSELGGSTQAGFHMIGRAFFKWTVLKSLLGSMSESGRDIFLLLQQFQFSASIMFILVTMPAKKFNFILAGSVLIRFQYLMFHAP